jgi:vacuolar-type H+-ATPase subunit H
VRPKRNRPGAASGTLGTHSYGREDLKVDILKLLDKLEDVVDDSMFEVWGRAYGIRSEEFHMLVNKIRASLPDELRTATRLACDTDKIVNAAREEAKSAIERAHKEAAGIVSAAKTQASQLVDSNEINRLAMAQAKEIVASAESTARDVRAGADEYAREVLANLENFTTRLMGTIQRGREKLDQRAHYAQPIDQPVFPSGREARRK